MIFHKPVKRTYFNDKLPSLSLVVFQSSPCLQIRKVHFQVQTSLFTNSAEWKANKQLCISKSAHLQNLFLYINPYGTFFAACPKSLLAIPFTCLIFSVFVVFVLTVPLSYSLGSNSKATAILTLMLLKLTRLIRKLQTPTKRYYHMIIISLY